MRTLALSALLSLFSLGASCGGPPPEATAPPVETSEAESDDDGGATAGPTGPAPEASAVPLPEMPSSNVPPRPERTAPTISDLDGAEEAFGHGFYEAVGAALPRFTKGSTNGRALLLRARLELETGRYAAADATAQQAARNAPQRLAATTLRGESLAARGQLDAAETVLEGLLSDQNAHRAHALLGQLHLRRGRTVEARPVFMRLIEAYNDDSISARDGEGLFYVALAAMGLGSARDANDAFQQSTAADPDNHEAQLAWAELFLDKYDAGHAEEGVNHVLARNPVHPRALALLARIKLEQSFDFSAAGELVGRALEANPNLVMAHVTRAGIALRDLDIATADGHLDTALAIDGHDLEALSVRAAVRYLADDQPGFLRAKREVLRRHRTYSRMYTTIADFADWEHRYPDIVSMAREAVALAPDDALAHATLGLNLLRMGDEEHGLEALREAWRRDRFNVRVYNMLNLYDDVIDAEYETFEAAPFTFRMHREERALLERYVPSTLQGAYADMRRRYGFTPEGPLRIEMFANTGHFSVRTVGLPNVGVQGVCFGKVVTAISPRGGPFNWGQITWHELAHVFHIQLSNNRVPRWFTEGLAEYETLIARPHWKREMDHMLYAALEADRLPPLPRMNQAFTQADSAEAITVAYYTSSQIVRYIAERFEFAKLVRMLREWGAGKTDAEVVQRSLGISIEQLDADFRAHTARRLAGHAGQLRVNFAAYRDLATRSAAATAAPNDAAAAAAHAVSLLVNGRAPEATAEATRALGLDTNQPIARFLMARIALSARDGLGAGQHIDKLLQAGHDGYDVRLLQARAALARQDAAAARSALEAATGIDRDRADAWMGLLEIAQQGSDDELELRVLLQLAVIDEHSREVNAALLTRLSALGRWQDVQRYGEMARFVDPHRGESHRLLAEAYARAGNGAGALREVESAEIAGVETPGVLELTRARALMAAGQRSQARQAADRARTADPNLAEAARRVLAGE